MSEQRGWEKKVKRLHEQEELERRAELEQYKREIARKKKEDEDKSLYYWNRVWDDKSL